MSSKRRSSSTASEAQDHLLSAEEAALSQPIAEPSPEPRPIARQQTYDVDRIGDILRRVREHRGEELESISDYLRIRPSYLIALENSRYEDLPADAYVIGFLRTYALYLGLDGKGAIDQYRREMAGRRKKPQLTMPQPMPEGRAPTITVMIGAAMAALLVYGIWYGLSSPSPVQREKPVPLTSVQEAPAQDTAAESPAIQMNATSLPAQTATSDGISLAIPVSAVPTTTTATEDKAQPPQSEPAKTATDTENKDQKDEKAIKEKEQKTEATTKDKTADKNKIEAVPLPAEPRDAAKKEATTTYGEKGKSRLSITADKESWVLVTDSKGNTVFEKTLKPGESYNVPSGKGLKLTTGNVSGMTFNLDGTSLPKMNSSDAIVRAVPLDPDKLKSRLTDSDTSSPE